MKFVVERKGEGKFLVVNEDTGVVKGRFIKEGEAKVHAERLQQTHDNEVRFSSASVAPKGREMGGT